MKRKQGEKRSIQLPNSLLGELNVQGEFAGLFCGTERAY